MWKVYRYPKDGQPFYFVLHFRYKGNKWWNWTIINKKIVSILKIKPSIHVLLIMIKLTRFFSKIKNDVLK